jgi:CRP-like cAMP-binding protein
MLAHEVADKPLFHGLGREELKRVAPLFATARFRSGETVFKQGQPAEHVYVLEQGEVALRLYPDDGGCLTIAVIQREGVFGWSAVLGRARYTAAAVCAADTQALVLPGSQLRALIRTEPALGRLLLGRLTLALVGRADGLEAHSQAHLERVIQAELAHSTT